MPGGRTKTKIQSTLQSRLAKSAAEFYVKEGQRLALPATLPPELQKQQACYVFIYEDPGHHTRASAGQTLPRSLSLAQEIINNTTQAVTGAVRRIDLPYLRYRVAVLGQLQRVTQPEHLNPHVYGLYVQSERGKSSLVLPQRVGIETPDDQVATALRESGIDTRQETPTMYRVPVTYYD